MSNNLKTLIFVLLLGGALGYFVSSLDIIPSKKGIGTDKAKQATETYLGTLPLDSFEVSAVEDIGDVYKVQLSVNEMPYTSYMTKDGKLLFQGGIDLTEAVGTEDTGGEQPQVMDLPKSDKPNVELFVMSHCPYGTQMEKGILPVVNALGDKIDFEIKFVDYAMHDKVEIDEQLNQYCIQKNMGKQTYLSYLDCFLKDGDTQRCIGEIGINQWELKNCIASTDQEFSITDNYNNKDTWVGQFPPFNTHKDDNLKYGIAGSPTLIINSVEAQTPRDSASLLATVCGSFNEQPEECLIQLDSASPAPGFGTATTTGSTDSAQCN